VLGEFVCCIVDICFIHLNSACGIEIVKIRILSFKHNVNSTVKKSVVAGVLKIKYYGD
jgi:hypothetical protein